MAGTRIGLVGGLALSLLLVSASIGSAQGADPWLGTWKLNLAKTTYNPGPPPQSSTLTIEAATGGAQKHTFHGVNAQGQPTHSERVAMFDETDVPVQAVQPPSQTVETNSFRRLDSRSFEVVNKRDGRLTGTTRVAVSADGKTMTMTRSGTNAQGQPESNIGVWEKQ
jgi:hypothetical protein